MYWQRVVLYKANALSAGVDLKFDLPKSGLLGSLALNFNATQVSGYGQGGGAWRIIDHITKVVVQHGSTPELVLTGFECQGFAAYDQNVCPPARHNNYAAASNHEYVLLNFGRNFKDMNMGLDLAMWNNTQVVISNDSTAASDLASITVDIVGWFLVDAPGRQFIGHLNKTEWFEWTTVQAEQRQFNLPDEDIIRRIMLQAIPHEDGTTHIADTGMANLMYNIKLGLKNRNEIVFDGYSGYLMRENLWENYGWWIGQGSNYNLAGKGFRGELGYRYGEAHGASAPHGTAVATVDATLQAYQSDFTLEAISYSADHPTDYIEVGIAPYNMFGFLFDWGTDPSGWLDPSIKKPLTLDILTRDASSAASGRNAVLLEVFKPH